MWPPQARGPSTAQDFTCARNSDPHLASILSKHDFHSHFDVEISSSGSVSGGDLVRIQLEPFRAKNQEFLDPIRVYALHSIVHRLITLLFELPVNEKLKYRADLENGGYNGYKPLGLREVRPGFQDNTEIYNIPSFIAKLDRPHPGFINAHRDEIERFARHIFDNVAGKLLVLLAIILELPENFFLEQHRYHQRSDCHLRYMKYHHRTPEHNAALENVWIKGHTDFGSLALLFRQPVAALQVRTLQGQWKHVKPYPGSITVNIADSLELLTNGFLKSSIDRVVAPPPDQADIDRLGVLYFVRPEDDVILTPIKSNVLEKLGYTKTSDENLVGITAGDWVKARVKNGVAKGLVRSEQTEEAIISGRSAKYYD